MAVVSDPHGDFGAFQRVIADLESRGPFDEVLLGGDLAQGGDQPCEVVDEITRRGWRAVRGNTDELLVRIADGLPAGEPLPPEVVSRLRWSARTLGRDRIEYLRSLPASIELGPCGFGKVVLVHATPWSTEEVVLPDAAEELAQKMIEASGARLVLYGHIHMPYQRPVGNGIIASVGAVSHSNDQDPRPAYTICTLDETIAIEVRRVDP